jgi:hypothetical protein
MAAWNSRAWWGRIAQTLTIYAKRLKYRINFIIHHFPTAFKSTTIGNYIDFRSLYHKIRYDLENQIIKIKLLMRDSHQNRFFENMNQRLKHLQADFTNNQPSRSPSPFQSPNRSQLSSNNSVISGASQRSVSNVK